jgi:hypothetical protein
MKQTAIAVAALRAGTVLVVAILSASCQQSSPNLPKVVASESIEVQQLMKNLESVQRDLSVLRARVEALVSEEAEVSTAGGAYGLARTKFGPFAFVGRGVAPHLDGYMIKLAVGNLTTATFHGAKLKIGWGPPFEKDKAIEYFTNRKEREFSVTTILSPGAYSVVEIAVVPAKPEEVRTITVGLQLDELSLRR